MLSRGEKAGVAGFVTFWVLSVLVSLGVSVAVIYFLIKAANHLF